MLMDALLNKMIRPVPVFGLKAVVSGYKLRVLNQFMAG